MNRAEEIFTMQLARAAGKQANRFLRSRGLPKDDRDDITSAALLWCWENRANYSLTTTLETWFMNAVRNSYQQFRRAELPPSSEQVESLGGGDDTHHIASVSSSVEALWTALTPVDREIAMLVVQGYTRTEMRERGYSTRAVHAAHRRVKQLRKLMPDQELRSYARRSGVTPIAPNPDDDESAEQTPIDREIEQLEFAPPTGKDCPPCWRCKWFEGLMPPGHRSTRMEIEDLEVRAAVRDTEARKVEIAQQVRDGE